MVTRPPAGPGASRVPSLLPRPGRTSRFFFGIAALLVLVLGALAFVSLGRVMASEDPLQRADAIFVFAGTFVERPLEAADLYREGYAPRIVVTRAVAEQAALDLERRGVRIPTEYDLNKEVLLKVGVPVAALILPSFIHDNTAEEARTLAELARQHGWRRVILVSSKYHLRRIKFAAWRELRGTHVDVIARGSRYDPATPHRWWTRRGDIRWLSTEVPKLLAYGMGLGE